MNNSCDISPEVYEELQFPIEIEGVDPEKLKYDTTVILLVGGKKLQEQEVKSR